MSNLSSILKEILIREDSITIPGFGTFTTSYQSAQLDEKNGEIQPPTKSVLLDTNNTNDPTNKLVETLKTLGINENEVQPMVDEFIKTVNDKLAQKTTYEIDGVGVLSRGDDNALTLIPVKSKLSIDNYGLEVEEVEIVSPTERVVTTTATVNAKNSNKSSDPKATTKLTTTKVTTSTTTTTTTQNKEEKKMSGLLKALLIILPIVAVLAILFYIFKDKILDIFNDNDNNTAQVENTDALLENPNENDDQNTLENSNIDPDLQILAQAQLANVSPLDIGSQYKKYYLIGGSFSDKFRAKKEMRKIGAKDILNVDNLYRIYFIATDNAQEIVDEYNKQLSRGIKSSEMWLLKNSKQ